ncbi:MAG: hypothetical protein JSS55_06490 [Proteobacteria bacterium]|nr:hypothetical protein [Pseudomonadota bacterium]
MTKLTFHLREMAEKANHEKRERLGRIPYEYASLLEKGPQGLVKNISLLPYPKNDLIKAFLFCIANAKSRVEIDLLCAALLTLADYQDIGDKDTVNIPDPSNFDHESKDGFGELMKAASSVTEVWQRVRDDVARDLSFFTLWSSKAIRVNENIWPFYKRWFEKLRPSNIYRTIPAKWVDFPD